MTKQENNDNRHRPNVPLLRFRGFTDPWQHKRLEDIGSSYAGLTGKSKKDFGHGEAQYVTYLNVYSNPIASRLGVDSIEIDNKQNEVHKGDILFTISSETPDEVGLSSVWLHEENTTYLNSFCFGFRPSIELDSYFAASLLRSPMIREEFKLLAQGISRFNISKKKAMEISPLFPSLAEQEKIGTFFRALDELIAAREEELEKLRQMKAALLEAMFPSDASHEEQVLANSTALSSQRDKDDLQLSEPSTPHTPRLRFRGFTDPWQRMRLGDVAVVSRGLTYNPSDVRHQGIRVLRSSNIAGDTFVISEEDVFVVRNCVNVDYARNGDILITAANGSAQLVGKHCIVDNIVDKSMVAGGFMFLLRSSQPHFLNASMSSSWYTRFISITSMGGGGAINNLRKNELEELYLPIPSLAEQKQIGAFFRSQDERIATAIEQIDKLKKIKQACLKQMFV